MVLVVIIYMYWGSILYDVQEQYFDLDENLF